MSFILRERRIQLFESVFARLFRSLEPRIAVSDLVGGPGIQN